MSFSCRKNDTKIIKFWLRRSFDSRAIILEATCHFQNFATFPSAKTSGLKTVDNLFPGIELRLTISIVGESFFEPYGSYAADM